ncbi:MAG TPA: type II CAAX endopeptidase family protein [Solirubrobacteraceae bacterium]|nr:type II CAAX endopeptidase family protein [Solirubrobacteraceae bacterium]
MASTPPTPTPHPPLQRPERPDGAPLRERRAALPGWPAWTAPVALLASLLVIAFLAAIVSVAVGVADPQADPADQPAARALGLTLLQNVVLVVAAIGFAWTVSRPWPRDFGLRGTRLGPGLGWAALAMAGFLAVSMALTLALEVEQQQSSENVLESLGVNQGVISFLLAALLVCVLVPIGEEVFFRGYFFTALRSRFRVGAAAAIAGVTFGSMHVLNFLTPGTSWQEGVVGTVSLSVFGIALCLLYWRTGSLYPCIGAHALNNTLAFSVTAGVTVLDGLALLAGVTVVIVGVLLPLHRLRPGPAPAPA